MLVRKEEGTVRALLARSDLPSDLSRTKLLHLHFSDETVRVGPFTFDPGNSLSGKGCLQV